MGVENLWSYLLRHDLCAYVKDTVDNGRNKSRTYRPKPNHRNRHINDVLGYMTDHLLLDMNSIMHAVYTSRKANTRATLQAILDCVRNIVAIVKPRESLSIVFDGVAPIIKLPRQKQRRVTLPSAIAYNDVEVQQSGLTHTAVESGTDTNVTGEPERGFAATTTCSHRVHGDPALSQEQPTYSQDVIGTPVPLRREEMSCGSQFMHACAEQVVKMLRSGVKGARYRTLLVSDANEAGEGEIKIARAIRYLWHTGRAQSSHSILIVSTDGDLALVELLAMPFRRLALLQPFTFSLTNIGALFTHWMHDVKSNLTSTVGSAGSKKSNNKGNNNNNKVPPDNTNIKIAASIRKDDCEVICGIPTARCSTPEDYAKTPEDRLLQRYRIDFVFLMCLVACDYYQGLSIDQVLKLWHVYRSQFRQQDGKCRLGSMALVLFHPTMHLNLAALGSLLHVRVAPVSSVDGADHATPLCEARPLSSSSSECGGAQCRPGDTVASCNEDECVALGSACMTRAALATRCGVSSLVAEGLTLLQAAWWSFSTILRGRCVDYNFMGCSNAQPSTASLRAALGVKDMSTLLERVRCMTRLFQTTRPVLSPLEQYIAIMGARVRYSSEIQRVLMTCMTSDERRRLITCFDIPYTVATVRALFAHVHTDRLPLSEKRAAERACDTCAQSAAEELVYFTRCP